MKCYHKNDACQNRRSTRLERHCVYLFLFSLFVVCVTVASFLDLKEVKTYASHTRETRGYTITELFGQQITINHASMTLKRDEIGFMKGLD